MSNVKLEEFSFPSPADGLQLQGYRWVAPKARARLVVAHGVGEHARRYTRLAETLVGTQIEVWALDHRGHGRSPGPGGLSDFGAAGWDGLVADLIELTRRARAAQPLQPLALFGHSLGSFAAQQLVLEHSRLLDALVLSGSTALRVPAPGEPRPDFRPNAAFEPARTPYDWLSRDPAEVDAYIADPLCGFDSERRVLTGSAVRRLADREALSRIRPDLPVLLVAGDADPLNRGLEGLHELERRYRRAGLARIDTRYYAGGRHEMLNEINRDEVTADLVDWLRDRLSNA